MHRIIHSAEVQELRNAVRNFGRNADGHHVVTFGDDDDDDEKPNDIKERPCVAVNVSKWETGPQDVYINSIDLTPDNHLVIHAETKDYGELFTLDTDDIEFGHVSFITDLIPDKEDHGEPSLIKTAEFTTVSGEWVKIHTQAESWEYQRDPEDEETYMEGCLETDDERPFTITGYDGCYELPYAVRDALKRLGYALEL